MKRDQIENAMNHISDSHIEEAMNASRKPQRIYWVGAIAAMLALAYYFLLPFPLEVRQTLVILAFSPIGSAVPGFTEELKGDVGLSCSINSLSILISIVIIVTLLVVML